jgi:hypothetical protein
VVRGEDAFVFVEALLDALPEGLWDGQVGNVGAKASDVAADLGDIAVGVGDVGAGQAAA